MRAARWALIGTMTVVALACGSGGRVLPRYMRASVERDYPACRGRVRGYELGNMQYRVTSCGLDVVYQCPGGRQECYQIGQTAGGYATQYPAQPQQQGAGVIVVTGGVSGSETITAYPAQPVQTDAQQVQAQPATTTTTAQPAAAAPTREQVEAGVGQWVDSHRAEILSCTGTPAALVEVTWDASGTPVVALGGEMHGSTGEPCVARVLSGVVFNTGGQAGSIRHVVQ